MTEENPWVQSEMPKMSESKAQLSSCEELRECTDQRKAKLFVVNCFE